MTPKHGLLDRALGAFGLVRQASVRRPTRIGLRTFAAARVDRLTEDLFSGTTSGRMDLKMDLRRLRNRARTMVRDSAVAKRYCELFVENVVGEVGIQLKPSALLANGNADTKLNDTITAAWLEWGQPRHCTLDGQLGWVEAQQALARWEPMDGEALIRLVDGAGPFGFQILVLDPDQLDDTMNVEPQGNGPRVRQGIEVDRHGRPIAYHIWQGHPNDTSRGTRERVPAEDVIHLASPFRPGTLRSPPWFHAAMVNINMLEGYLEAALVAARVAASASINIAGAEADEDEVSETPVEMTAGSIFKTAAGETATLLDPKHPTTTAAEFYKLCVRSIASAGGVAYTSLSGDLEAVNYSSIRAGLLSERDRYRILQQRMIRYVHSRIYARWLVQAQLFGALRIPATDLARAARVRFQPRGFAWVDPLKDVEALRAEIALGLNSRTAAAADRGRDFERTLEELDAEKKLAAQYGVDVSGAEVSMPAEDAANTTTPPKRELRIAHA